MSKTYNIKLAVLGKTLVGKSALTFRFISDKFPTEHDTTVEDEFKIMSTIDDSLCEIDIIDTAGQDDYQTLLDTWIVTSNCYLLVYAIDDLESFQQIKIRYDRICHLKKDEKFSLVIVGNKCDLAESRRKVTKNEAENYGKNIGAMAIEASALTNVNVKEAFLQAIRDYLKIKKDEEKKFGIGCPCF